ncbi:MAG: hypothetical protein K9N49_01665 [Candidatus Marinimicrobia bacterium]|nr:hypothetical protein [Candidatus Neomarinimicrobiota bacterium]
MSAAEPRRQVPAEAGWQFARGRVSRAWLRGAGERGQPVQLPHCWNEADTFQPGVAYYRGWGAYRRVLPELPELPGGQAEGAWHLELGGFYGVGDVWLAGVRRARLDGQYLGASIPLPPGVAPGAWLALRLSNRCGRNVLPGISDPDFLLYGGLAGGATFVHRPHYRLREDTLRVGYGDPLGARVTISVAVTAANGGAGPRAGRVELTLLDAAGQPVAAACAPLAGLAGGQQAAATLVCELSEPRRWDIESPYLYRLRLDLRDEEGRLQDRVARRIGLRAAEWRPRAGFFLNGRRVALHGVNRHESLPGFGSALPPELQRADAVQIKALGCNCVRLSHYPQHPAFWDACDELGLLVYAELASWKSVRPGRWQRAALRQWRAMIERDRHRPSLILWGMGNESRSRRVYVALRDLAHALDPGRPVTYAENHLYRARRQKTIGLPDVWALNYELEACAAGCAASRLENVLVSELANYPPAARGCVAEEQAQVALIEEEWAALAAHPEVAGHLLWCFSDYATERKRRTLRQCGMVDAWRHPKRAAALLQARYLSEPFLAVYADWSLDHPASSRQVEIYTNAPSVSAWDAAGGRLAAWNGTAPRREVALSFTGQPVTFIAHHPRGDTQICLTPWSAPVRLALRVEQRSNPWPIRATLPVDIRVLDAQDRLVADAATWVTPEVSGPVRLRSCRADGRVPMASGIGRLYVTGTGGGGQVAVAARAPDLATGRLHLTFAGEQPEVV